MLFRSPYRLEHPHPAGQWRRLRQAGHRHHDRLGAHLVTGRPAHRLRQRGVAASTSAKHRAPRRAGSLDGPGPPRIAGDPGRLRDFRDDPGLGLAHKVSAVCAAVAAAGGRAERLAADASDLTVNPPCCRGRLAFRSARCENASSRPARVGAFQPWSQMAPAAACAVDERGGVRAESVVASPPAARDQSPAPYRRLAEPCTSKPAGRGGLAFGNASGPPRGRELEHPQPLGDLTSPQPFALSSGRSASA